MDHRQSFIIWYHEVFQASTEYQEMLQTVEDSPWHRERNVAVHTDMVVSQYIARSPWDWAEENLRGALACAFHDVGKPAAEETRFKPERGEYRAYTGHESVSARAWEQFAVTNWKELTDTFRLRSFSIYAVAWMIEHHLPYGLKKANKLDRLHKTAYEVGNGESVFSTVLVSDAFGRISDDADTKRQSVLEYTRDLDDNMLRFAPPYEHVKYTDRTLVLTIGASGSGKSTFLTQQAGVQFSWDNLRLEWYSSDYTEAAKQSFADKSFITRANARFVEILKTDVASVCVDNTNVSVKSRRFFIEQAQRHGFHVVAVLFPINKQMLMDRQASRTDKTVPVDAVLNQWNRTQMPFYGEVDEVTVHVGNL